VRRLALAISLAAALAVAAVALADSSYTLRLTGATLVKPGGVLNVGAKGIAPKRSVLNIIIDRRKCAAGAYAESQRYGANGDARPGYPYFISAEGVKVVGYSEPVRGTFARVAPLHAGSVSVTEHLCAYLNVLDAPTPQSVAATTRTVRVRG